MNISSHSTPNGSLPDLGVVAVVVRESKFLVIRRSQFVRAPGKLCFPGGGIQPGEDEATALRRELQEELRVAIEPVERIWSSITPWGVSLAWWKARLPAQETLVPNPEEVEAVYWYTQEELLASPDLLESNRHFFAAAESRYVKP